MRERLSPTSALIGQGLDETTGLVTDSCLSRGTLGVVVGRAATKAFVGAD
jgi:dihydroxy-acid dehydratase